MEDDQTELHFLHQQPPTTVVLHLQCYLDDEGGSLDAQAISRSPDEAQALFSHHCCHEGRSELGAAPNINQRQKNRTVFHVIVDQCLLSTNHTCSAHIQIYTVPYWTAETAGSKYEKVQETAYCDHTTLRRGVSLGLHAEPAKELLPTEENEKQPASCFDKCGYDNDHPLLTRQMRITAGDCYHLEVIKSFHDWRF
ncbi:hypothetical protein CBL_06415 [Carabus blaptoides fortunei]